MKNFKYSARDTAGAMRKGNLEAVDRAAALQALTQQGLMPVSVEEGTARKAALRLSGLPVTALLGVLAIVVLVVAALRMLPDRKKPVTLGQASAMKKTELVRPESPRPAVVPGRSVSPVMQQEQPPVAPVPERSSPAVRAKPPATDRPKPNERALPATPTNQPPRHFSSGTEQVISMIVNTRKGFPPPPLLRLPAGENIAEILERDIPVYDDDSAKTVAAKENVAHAKQMLKEYRQAGGNPEEFLQHYHDTLKSAFEERQAAQKYTMELIRIGDKKGAAEYMTEKNKELEAKNIQPVTIPKFMR